MHHDEQDAEERRQLEKVRCFLSNVKWKVIEEDDSETPGMTWLELYIYYAIHGGCDHIREKQRAQPLAKVETLQTAIAKFKARTRKIARHCTEEADELYTKVSYAKRK